MEFALSATLTVIAPDDYGNSAAAAAAIGVNSTTAGLIGTGGDTDWFKFQAVAGKKYTISTALAGLPDSVLTLYDRNGSTQLAVNDDIASNNPASRIQWTAPAGGTYFIKVAAYDTRQTGGYKLSLTAQNSPPVLQNISDQILTNKAGGIVIPLAASDPDGDRLTFSATAYTIDPKTQTHVSVPGSKAALTLSGNQLRITRNANYTGVFYVDVTASDGANTVLKSFKVTATNTTVQWLGGSSISSLGDFEIPPQRAISAPAFTAVVLPAPATNSSADWQKLFSTVRSDDAIISEMQGIDRCALPGNMSFQAVKYAFHENDGRGTSWLSDRSGYLSNVLWNAFTRGDRILDAKTSGGTGAIAGSPGKSGDFLEDGSDLDSSVDIEAAIESWNNQSFEAGSFDEFFALLAQD